MYGELVRTYFFNTCAGVVVPGTLQIESSQSTLITGTNQIMKGFLNIPKIRHGSQTKGHFSGQISSIRNIRIWIYPKSNEIRIHTHEECRVH